MKSHLLIPFLFLSVAFPSENTANDKGKQFESFEKKGVDYSYINSVPSLVRGVVLRYATSDRDSTPAICQKRSDIYDALVNIEKNTILKYYTNSEIALKDLEAIPTLAKLWTDLHYPMCPSTGASGYVGLLQDQENRTIFTIMKLTGHEILDAAKDYKVSGPLPKDINTWDKEWQKIIVP